MTNDEFRQHIAKRLQEVRATLADKETDPETRKALVEQERLLVRADRMGHYSSGQAFRRFRRDYERRLGNGRKV